MKTKNTIHFFEISNFKVIKFLTVAFILIALFTQKISAATEVSHSTSLQSTISRTLSGMLKSSTTNNGLFNTTAFKRATLSTTMYARIEIQTPQYAPPSSNTEWGDLYIRFYEDEACTIPAALPYETSLWFDYDMNCYFGNGNVYSTYYGAQGGGGNTELNIGVVDLRYTNPNQPAYSNYKEYSLRNWSESSYTVIARPTVRVY